MSGLRTDIDESFPGSRASKLSTAREKAEWLLARRLYEEMERLDPSGPNDFVAWDRLESRHRDYYRLSVRAVLSERTLCRLAIR
jgi:hypothetical protein